MRMGTIEVFQKFKLKVGLVIAARVLDGVLVPGSVIDFDGKKATVKSLQVDRKDVPEGTPGMEVGALVEGVTAEDVENKQYSFE